MPDLMTHTATSYLLCRIINIKKRYLILFLIGTILPDILTRGVFYTVNPLLHPDSWLSKNLWNLIQPIHTPVGIILTCLLISYLFEEYYRKVVFIFLCLGAFSHFMLDILQCSMVGGSFWLFPFSLTRFQIGLFWAEQSLYAISFLLLAIFCIEVIRKVLNGSSSKS